MASASSASAVKAAAATKASLPKVNVSFSGCGFLGVYHVGSLAAWLDHVNRSVERGADAPMEPGEPPRFVVDNALGASAGALVATALVINYPAASLKTKFMEIAADVKSMTFGPFNPKFNVNKIFGEELDKVLPPDAHRLVENRLHISMTDTSMQNVIHCQFASRKDLMDALICSCFLPAFSAYEVPTYAGKPFLDGGFSNNQPVLDDRTTVRVSPFAGGSHICPDDGTPIDKRFIFQKFAGEKMELSFSNMKRIAEAMTPAENLESLYCQGYQHTDSFIRSGKIRDFFKMPAASSPTTTSPLTVAAAGSTLLRPPPPPPPTPSSSSSSSSADGAKQNQTEDTAANNQPKQAKGR